MTEYNGWLRKKNETVAICKYCCKVIRVGNMGEQALKSHMKGQKHKDRTPKSSIASHFQPASSSKTETSSSKTETSSSKTETSSSKTETVVPFTSTQTTEGSSY